MNKQIEALKLALETAEGIANSDWRKWEELASPEEFERWVKSRALHMATALRDRLAQPQQAHEINADEDAIGMAIQDTFVCGTGVLKLWLDGGKMQFDHVPIKDFNVFGDELKWRAAHTGEEKHND